MAKSEKVYCSVVLSTGMEYMVYARDGWQDEISGAVFNAKTIDNKPISFGLSGVSLIREVSKEEYEVWRKSLEEYRQRKIQEAEAEKTGV